LIDRGCRAVHISRIAELDSAAAAAAAHNDNDDVEIRCNNCEAGICDFIKVPRRFCKLSLAKTHTQHVFKRRLLLPMLKRLHFRTIPMQNKTHF